MEEEEIQPLSQEEDIIVVDQPDSSPSPPPPKLSSPASPGAIEYYAEETHGGKNKERLLLSTSDEIFKIPPMLNIDEKLFQDEVIRWSHYVPLHVALRRSTSISFTTKENIKNLFNIRKIFTIFTFFFFLILTVALAICANKFLSGRAAILTLWLLVPIIIFSIFNLVKILAEYLYTSFLSSIYLPS